MDTAFWQKSFASEVQSTVPAYDIVSVVIIAVPWCTGTIVGLAARAIEKTPVWCIYPTTLTDTQVNSGLVMPYVLMSLLGKGATTGLLVLIFMAITSTVSSSMIAVSSIISQDWFRTYINPRASDRRTLQVSHWGVVFHGCFMAGFSIMLEYAGATNNFSTYFRPIIACPGIFPMMLTLLWSRQTKLAAIVAPILGLLSGMATWFACTWHWSGAINIDTLQDQVPGLYGAIVSFFSPALYSVIISLLYPSRFDWREFLRIELIEDNKSQPTSSLPSKLPSTEAVDAIDSHTSTSADAADTEKKGAAYLTSAPVSTSPEPSCPADDGPRANYRKQNLDDVVHPFSEATIADINRWLRIASVYFVVNVLVTVVLWPIPLYRDWIFTKSFFTGWVTMALIWLWAAFFTVVVYPIYDGRHAIAKAVRGMRAELGW